MTADLLVFLTGKRERVLELQSDMVAVPALGPENGGQGEEFKAQYLSGVLRHIGVGRVLALNAPDPRVACGFRPNVAAIIPGRNPKRTLWFVSHMDVVPTGDRDLWASDPFSLRVDGDTIHGRGVEDNHHGLVASLLAAEALLTLNIQPRINCGLLFVADEETGNAFGLEYLLDRHAELFGPDDLFVVPDFGAPDSSMVEVAEKGLLWLKLTVHGRQCHASTPSEGINTLLAASDLILRLRRLYQEFDRRDSLFIPDHSTFEATKKEANVPNINTIPGKDVFYLDCRVLPEYGLADVMDRIRTIAVETETALGVRVDCDVVHQESAPATDPEAPIVQALVRAVQRVAGVQAGPRGIGGGTVAALVRRRNYPAAVWSTIQNTAHQPDERTRISDIIRDAQVFVTLLLDETWT